MNSAPPAVNTAGRYPRAAHPPAIDTAGPDAGKAAGFRWLTVKAVEWLTADAVAITFEVPESMRAAFGFRAGQHLTLRRELASQDVRRTYSICSSTAGGPLRIAVKRLPGGVFTEWALAELQPGDQVEVLPPAGHFGPTVDPGRARRYGLVAAGSGITPVLAIAATVLDVEPASNVVLVFGNRTSQEVMFADELADLKDRHGTRLQLVHVLSREEQASELLSGRLDTARMRRLLTTLVPCDEVDEWYVCGPFGMVADVRQALAGANVPGDRVHHELFHADPAPPRPRPAQPTGPAATVVVSLYGRSSTILLDRDGAPVLDAVLAVRPDAPYACKGGVCGTCRARLVVGQVEMDVNYALEPEELAAGVVLTCQSHPVTDLVRLDFL